MECYEISEQDDWALQAQLEPEPVANYSQSEDQSENESSDSRAKRRKRSYSSGPSDNVSQNQIFLTNDIIEAPSTSAAPVVTPRTEDTYDNFGKYIASLLRSLPASKALRLQPRIVDMIVSVSVGEEENHILVEIDKLSDSQAKWHESPFLF